MIVKLCLVLAVVVVLFVLVVWDAVRVVGKPGIVP